MIEANALHGLRVLCVDDHGESLKALARLLGARGALVATAGSASEARARFESGSFDALVSDISMPGEDGFSLVRSLREGGGPNAAILVIAVSGLDNPRDRARAFSCGFDCFLAKPVDAERLLFLLAAGALRAREECAQERARLVRPSH